MKKLNQHGSVDLIILVFLVIIVGNVDFAFWKIHNTFSSSSFALGKQFTLRVGDSSKLTYGDDNISIKLTDVYLSNCDLDSNGWLLVQCTPRDMVTIQLSVNGTTEEQFITPPQGNIVGSKLGYGVVLQTYKFGKSATFVIDTLPKS